MTVFSSDFGQRLFELLPAVYRSRDNGDLARYLDGCGHLLDLFDQTLRQRLADAFPDHPPADRLACQEWLLPYFAGLLDVRLVSPHTEGRRTEIGSAVAWRQRKGTRAVVEQVAQAVAQMEVELHEGWQRVAVTPHIGLPLPSARSLGSASEPAEDGQGLLRFPSLGARHPGLPATMVDLRCMSRAVASAPGNPAAKATRFDAGGPVYWRQAAPHGGPCFPGSFEDRSRRTVDLRTPTVTRGHHHPRRLLLFAPPPAGFFPTPRTPVELTLDVGAPLTIEPCRDNETSACAEFVSQEPTQEVRVGDRGALEIDPGPDGLLLPMVVTAVAEANITLELPLPPSEITFPLDPARVRLKLQDALPIRWNQRHQPRYRALLELGTKIQNDTAGQHPVQAVQNATLGTRWYLPIRILGRIELDSPSTYRFEGLTLVNTLSLDRGYLELREIAALRVEVHTVDLERPVMDARDSLIRTLLIPAGLSRLEYCTVLDPVIAAGMHASDSIFMGPMRQSGLPLQAPSPICLRYCRFPSEQIRNGGVFYRSNSDPVIFFTALFGDRGCAVLHPASAASVRFGTEDGGEMGAYHERRYNLQVAAVLDKLEDFLPVGIEAVLIPDHRLLQTPP